MAARVAEDAVAEGAPAGQPPAGLAQAQLGGEPRRRRGRGRGRRGRRRRRAGGVHLGGGARVVGGHGGGRRAGPMAMPLAVQREALLQLRVQAREGLAQLGPLME